MFVDEAVKRANWYVDFENVETNTIKSKLSSVARHKYKSPSCSGSATARHA